MLKLYLTMEEDNIENVPPYQRLQAILSQGKSAKELKLTNKGHNNLDALFGNVEESKPTFWDKVKSFFSKIDSKIFNKPSKITNKYQKR